MDDNNEQHDQQIYALEVPAPQLASPDGRGPVLVHALEGFSDAGHAIRLAAEHLTGTLDSELVASFAIDDLLDYRSRRPMMTFKSDHFSRYEDPRLNLYALRDSVGTPFLLLAGLEPDLKWERFITAVRLLAERLDVRQTIGLGTIPMAVPHTRPVTMTAHSNNRDLIADHQPWVNEVQVPGSVSNLLEYRMAQHGHDAVGFTVHVPHYLAQTDYPAGAEALLEQVAKGSVDRTVFADLRVGHAGVGRGLGAGETCLLHDARGPHAFADSGGGFTRFLRAEIVDRQCGRFDVEVDAVEQRAADPGAVALHLRRCATALVFGVTKIAARAGVHGPHEQEASRERDRAVRARHAVRRAARAGPAAVAHARAHGVGRRARHGLPARAGAHHPAGPQDAELARDGAPRGQGGRLRHFGGDFRIVN